MAKYFFEIVACHWTQFIVWFLKWAGSASKSQLPRLLPTAESATQTPWLPPLHQSFMLVVDDYFVVVDTTFHMLDGIVHTIPGIELNETVLFWLTRNDIPHNTTSNDFPVLSEFMLQRVFVGFHMKTAHKYCVPRIAHDPFIWLVRWVECAYNTMVMWIGVSPCLKIQMKKQLVAFEMIEYKEKNIGRTINRTNAYGIITVCVFWPFLRISLTHTWIDGSRRRRCLTRSPKKWKQLLTIRMADAFNAVHSTTSFTTGCHWTHVRFAECQLLHTSIVRRCDCSFSACLRFSFLLERIYAEILPFDWRQRVIDYRYLQIGICVNDS